MKIRPIINKIIATAIAIGFVALTPITTYAQTITIFDDLVPLADPAASEDVMAIDQTDAIAVVSLEDNVIGTAIWNFSSWVTSYTKQANFYLVDENGEAADFYTDTLLDKTYNRQGTSIGADNIENTLGGIASTDAYTVEYQGLYTEATGGEKITDIKYEYESWPSTNTWSVKKSGKQHYTKLNNSADTISFYVRYKVTKNTGLSISDDTLTTEGRLKATYISADSSDTSNVTYEWSKSTDGGNTYTPCVNKTYEISSDETEDVIVGNTINIVLDDGVPSSTSQKYFYKVKAVDAAGTTLAESEPYQVTYYNRIQNGSFEEPDLSKFATNDNYNRRYNYQLTNKAYPQVIWKSTVTTHNSYYNADVEIEIINVEDKTEKEKASAAYNIYHQNADYSDIKAADGDQFAEINCEAEAALYQDVLTVKGKTLNYWFSHRARGKSENVQEKDTMYLVIMPREIATDPNLDIDGKGSVGIDTQDELNEVLNSVSGADLESGIYLTGSYKGTFVRKVTSDDFAWSHYQGTYNVESYATRFFFLAGETAAGTTRGNFVDRIGFSTELPPVRVDQAQMSIKKVISGLTGEQAERVADEIEITISAKKADGTVVSSPFVSTISGNEMDWTWKNNTYVGTYDFGAQDIGKNTYIYTATENSEDTGLLVEGYTLTPTKSVNASSTARINADGTVDVCSESNVEFTFNNAYSSEVTNPKDTYKKTAEVKDESERTYTIELQAQKTELETNIPADSMPINLVIINDISDSTLTTKAQAVINNLKDSLPEGSEVIAVSGDNNFGLNAAKTHVQDISNSNNIFVVLLTDRTSFNSNCRTTADEIKKKAAIYTVDLSNNSQTEAFLKNCASTPANSFYHKTKVDELGDTLTTIKAAMLGTSLSIKICQGNVVDVIDSRFDLIADNGTKIAETRDRCTIGGKEASVTVEDGKTTITWSNQELGVKDSANGTITPWTTSFTIKAKEDFLGGNLIATNGSDSGVDTDKDDIVDQKFPQPAVNVKPLDITIDSGDEYVFLGDKFTVYQDKVTVADDNSGALNWLLKNISIKSLQITDNTQLNGIFNNKESDVYKYTADYSYGTTEDEVGTVEYIFTPASDVSQYIGKDGEAVETSDDGTVATWTLSIQYKPLSVEDRQKLDTAKGSYSKDKNHGDEVTAAACKKAEGNYKDHAVTLALNIQKNGLGSDGKTTNPLGGATFTLKSGRYKVDEGISDAKTGLVTFNNLKTGIYTIQETSAPSGWASNDTIYTLAIDKIPSDSDDKLYSVKVTRNDGKDKDIDCTVNVTTLKATMDGKEYDLSGIGTLLTLTVTDQMAYELPHTGGSGIYLYTISGILLLMAAALLIYKNKQGKK